MIQCWLQKGDSFAGFGSYEEQQHHQRTRKSKSVRCQRPGALLIVQNANSVRLSKNATEFLHEPSSTVLKLLNSLIFSASKCVWSHQCKWGCQTGAKNWKYGRHNSWILAHAKSCNKSQKGALQHLDQQWDNSSNSFCFILIPVQHHLMGSKKPGKNMLWRWFHVYLQQKCEAWNCAQFHVLWLAISI